LHYYCKAIITPVAEIDNTHYYDPVDEVVYGVDHITLVCPKHSLTFHFPCFHFDFFSFFILRIFLQKTEESSLAVPTSEDVGLNTLRTCLQSKLNAYMKLNYFNGDGSTALAFVKDSGLQIVISGEKVNLRNFWTGKWSSIWNLSPMNLETGKYNLTGEIKVSYHHLFTLLPLTLLILCKDTCTLF